MGDVKKSLGRNGDRGQIAEIDKSDFSMNNIHLDIISIKVGMKRIRFCKANSLASSCYRPV